jgi:hypothetical protein
VNIRPYKTDAPRFVCTPGSAHKPVALGRFGVMNIDVDGRTIKTGFQLRPYRSGHGRIDEGKQHAAMRLLRKRPA